MQKSKCESDNLTTPKWLYLYLLFDVADSREDLEVKLSFGERQSSSSRQSKLDGPFRSDEKRINLAGAKLASRRSARTMKFGAVFHIVRVWQFRG